MRNCSWCALAVALAGLGLAGCMTLERAAPTAAVLTATGNAPSAVLARGRDLYITACAKCHQPEPVLAYPLADWRTDILPRMNKLTRLDGEDARALDAYIAAVHRQAAARSQ